MMHKMLTTPAALVVVTATAGAAHAEGPNLAPCNWAIEELGLAPGLEHLRNPEKELDAKQVRQCLAALVIELQFNRGERAKLQEELDRLASRGMLRYGRPGEWSYCYDTRAECAAVLDR